MVWGAGQCNYDTSGLIFQLTLITESLFTYVNIAMSSPTVRKNSFSKKLFRSTTIRKKSLYKFVDTFLDRESELTLLSSKDLQETVNAFNKFFEEKVENIRTSLPETQRNLSSLIFCGSKLNEFLEVKISEVEDILKDSGIKTSFIDPLP